MQKNCCLNFPLPIHPASTVHCLLLLSDLTTHCEEIMNFSSDEGSQYAKMFVKLSSAYWILKTFIPVGSKYHLLILWQELPHATIHLPEGQFESDLDETGLINTTFHLRSGRRHVPTVALWAGMVFWYRNPRWPPLQLCSSGDTGALRSAGPCNQCWIYLMCCCPIENVG